MSIPVQIELFGSDGMWVGTHEERYLYPPSVGDRIRHEYGLYAVTRRLVTPEGVFGHAEHV